MFFLSDFNSDYITFKVDGTLLLSLHWLAALNKYDILKMMHNQDFGGLSLIGKIYRLI